MWVEKRITDGHLPGGSHKNLASGVCVCVGTHTLTCVAKCPVESVL